MASVSAVTPIYTLGNREVALSFARAVKRMVVETRRCSEDTTVFPDGERGLKCGALKVGDRPHIVGAIAGCLLRGWLRVGGGQLIRLGSICRMHGLCRSNAGRWAARAPPAIGLPCCRPTLALRETSVVSNADSRPFAVEAETLAAGLGAPPAVLTYLRILERAGDIR